MALNPNNVQEKEPVLKYINKGGIYELMIIDIIVKHSKAGDSYQIVYDVEVPIEGQDEGQKGRVSTSYVKEGNSFEEQEFEKLIAIAKSCSVNVSDLPVFNTLEEAINTLTPMITGKIFRAKLTEEWYFNANSEERFNLRFPRYSFVGKNGEKFFISFTENVNIIPSDRTRLKFDPTNMWDVNKSAISPRIVDTEDMTSVIDDLPFN